MTRKNQKKTFRTNNLLRNMEKRRQNFYWWYLLINKNYNNIYYHPTYTSSPPNVRSDSDFLRYKWWAIKNGEKKLDVQIRVLSSQKRPEFEVWVFIRQFADRMNNSCFATGRLINQPPSSSKSGVAISEHHVSIYVVGVRLNCSTRELFNAFIAVSRFIDDDKRHSRHFSSKMFPVFIFGCFDAYAIDIFEPPA